MALIFELSILCQKQVNQRIKLVTVVAVNAVLNKPPVN